MSAYHLSTSATAGSNQRVALVDAYNDPNIEADLGTFDTSYGLPSCTIANGCLKIVSQTGSTSVLPANDTTGWSVEESLDVEAVHSACPACRILLVEANSQNDSDLAAAENEAAALNATEISNSFGEPEGNSTSTFQSSFNHPGIVITAASGDDGYDSYDWLGTNGGDINQPDIPAAYNTVVAVGGTSLYLGSTATRQYETVWNENGAMDYDEALTGLSLGASGGGCSTMFAGMGWQTAEPGYSSAVCAGKRLVADISMVADPITGFDIYDSYSCGSLECPTSGTWMTIGGTSLSSPLIAAAFALSGGAQGVPYPALTLYGHPSSTRYDVTIGGNGFCDGAGPAQCNASVWGGTNPNLLGFGTLDCAWDALGNAAAGTGACEATTGFDGPSGLGTPNSMTLFAKTGPNFTINPAPATASVNVSTAFGTTKPSDPFPGGAVAQYTWNWGDGTLNTVTAGPTSSVHHTFTVGGGAIRSVTVTARDTYGITTAKTLHVTVH